jgi:hypothetical protein
VVADWELAKQKSLAELILEYALFGAIEAGFLLGGTLHPGSHPDLLVVGCWWRSGWVSDHEP